MDLDILFWLAIGAIYLFQMFAGKNRQKQVPGQTPVPTGTGSTGKSTSPHTSQTSSTGQAQAAPPLQDALREISDILSGKPVRPENRPKNRPASGPSAPDETGTRRSSASPSSTSTRPVRESTPNRRTDSEFRSPLRKEKESAEERKRRLAELRKKHRTHRTKPLGGVHSEPATLDEDVFERRSRAPRSSTYDDLFESPLYESFGDPIDHNELKVEILEPGKTAADGLPVQMRLSRDDARQGIILSEILGPPVSKKRSR